MNTAAQSAYDALVMALAEAQAEVNADLEQLPIIPEQHGMNVLDSFSSDDNEEDFGEDAGADDGAAANAVGVHAGANDALVVGEEQELTTNCERVLHLRRLMDRGGDSLRMSLQQLASLCQMRDNARQRDFKDELRRQGVIERMVQTIEEAEGDAQRGNYNSTRDLRYELYNALARSLFDHRQNTVLVTELGLLKTTGEALCRCEQREDEDLSETQLCCVNNACGMILSGKHQLVLSSGIIPVLVRYAGGEANTTRTGRQIATAALANLSNTPDLCQALIQAGAVEVLAQGLHVVQEGEREATVGYMQSLSAVVKTVGRGCLMGLKHPRPCFPPRRETQCETGPSMLAMSTSHPAPSCHEVQDEKVFRVNGIHSSTRFDQSSMSELVVDRRSARWMLEYLSASCDGDAYPSSSNIYGTAWKVAQSVACMAQASAENRLLLHEEGVWPQLIRTLLRDLDQQGLLIEEDERRQTEMHVVSAMRKLLRHPSDVVACHAAVARVREPFSHFRLKIEAMAAGRSSWQPPQLRAPVRRPCGMRVHEGGLGIRGLCCEHSRHTREVAAELLLTWGYAWEIERLIWVAIKKPLARKPADTTAAPDTMSLMAASKPAVSGHIGMLTPSMVRRVMILLVMGGQV